MRLTRAAALALMALWACLAPGQLLGASLRDQFTGPTKPLGKALADTVGRSLPVLSASPGVTFAYDPASGGYVRNTDLLGQLYLERAQPLGRGRWNVTLSYQRVHVDSVQGQDIEKLSDTGLPIITNRFNNNQSNPQGAGLVRFDRFAVDLTVNQVTLAATYGITDNLDVNLTLPILASSLAIDAERRTFTRDPNENFLVPTTNAFQREQSSASAAGVGDMFLRTKYRFLKRDWVDVAGGLVLRMPTGSQDNFQGTGDWELSPLLYASTKRLPLASKTAVSFYVNGGVDLNISDVDVSQGRFGAGTDLALGNVVTLSLAFLGREPFHGFQPAGSFDLARYNPRNGCPTAAPTCNGGRPVAPLFGLQTSRASYYTLSMGGRVNLWRDTIFGFANVLVPLTDQGIGTAPIPLVGFEATF